jgi:hypothetical protein
MTGDAITHPAVPYVLVPRMQIIWSVLEGPQDVGDDHMIAACRRLITADRIGWRRHHDPADWELVKLFADVVEGEVPFPEGEPT